MAKRHRRKVQLVIRCLIIDDTEAFMLLWLSDWLWNGQRPGLVPPRPFGRALARTGASSRSIEAALTLRVYFFVLFDHLNIAAFLAIS
jgi:hypothetical protein